MSTSFTDLGRELVALLDAATPGVLFEANLVPLSAKGKLRVRYNWLYSALNCNPNDHSDFLWNVEKLTNGKVALSPAVPYVGKHLYASVRPDWNYYVQVQAPHSADWITRAQADEFLTMTARDLMYVSFTGLNGALLAVQGSKSDHGGYGAYRIRSDASALSSDSTWFPGIVNAVQPAFRSFTDFRPTAKDIEMVMEHAGLPVSGGGAATVARQLVAS